MVGATSVEFLDAPEEGGYTGSSVEISFATPEDAETNCIVDGQSRPCRSPLRLGGLAAGSHTIQIEAISSRRHRDHRSDRLDGRRHRPGRPLLPLSRLTATSRSPSPTGAATRADRTSPATRCGSGARPPWQLLARPRRPRPDQRAAARAQPSTSAPGKTAASPSAPSTAPATSRRGTRRAAPPARSTSRRSSGTGAGSSSAARASPTATRSRRDAPAPRSPTSSAGRQGAGLRRPLPRLREARHRGRRAPHEGDRPREDEAGPGGDRVLRRALDPPARGQAAPGRARRRPRHRRRSGGLANHG